MLVSKIPTRVDVPHEEGEWFELRKLSWTQLRSARKIAERENRNVMKELGAKFAKAFHSPEASKKAKKFIEQEAWNPDNFDAATLLNASVAAWSYEEEVGPDAISSLDTTTSEWASREIINMSKPENAKAEKKDSSGSTEP